MKGILTADRTSGSFEAVDVGQPQPRPASHALEAAGMQKNLPFREVDLYLAVQQVALRAFKNPEGGIYLQGRMYNGQGFYLVVNLIMEKLLVGGYVFIITLRPDQETVPLLVVLLISAVAAFVGISMPNHQNHFECD